MTSSILRRQYFNSTTIPEDPSAGLVLGIQSIPDGLATGLLALVNPVYGLHALMVGTPLGVLFSESEFMAIIAVVIVVRMEYRGSTPGWEHCSPTPFSSN